MLLPSQQALNICVNLLGYDATIFFVYLYLFRAPYWYTVSSFYLILHWKNLKKRYLLIFQHLPSRPIPGKGALKVAVTTTGCADDSHHVKYLEHVQAVITLSFSRRGDLSIKLISPRGTVAILLAQRRQDYSSSGFTDWEFMSTHTWGEDPKGTWTLEIENHGKNFGIVTRFWETAPLPLP